MVRVQSKSKEDGVVFKGWGIRNVTGSVLALELPHISAYKLNYFPQNSI